MYWQIESNKGLMRGHIACSTALTSREIEINEDQTMKIIRFVILGTRRAYDTKSVTNMNYKQTLIQYVPFCLMQFHFGMYVTPNGVRYESWPSRQP